MIKTIFPTSLIPTSILAALIANSAAAAPEGMKPISDKPSVLIEEGSDQAFGAIFLSKSRMVRADGRVLDLEFVSEDIEDPGSDDMGEMAALQRFTLKNPADLGDDERLCGGKARLMTSSIWDEKPAQVLIDFYDIASFDEMARMTQPCASDGFRFNQVAVVDGTSINAGPARTGDTTGGSPTVPDVDMGALDAAYTAAAAVAPTINFPEPAPDPGKWMKSVDTNPIDDTKSVFLSLIADEGRSSYGKPIVMTARCKSNETELYINWNDYLGDDSRDVYSDSKYVTVRLGPRKAEDQEWSVSTDSQATFAPGWAGNLLKEMVKEERMVVSTTPYNENPVTAIFDIRGLEQPLRELAETCGWSF